MSDLQLALLGLGGVIILSVVLFNWWQERRFRKEVAERFETPEHDVLMDNDFSIDPSANVIDDEPAVLKSSIADEAFEPQPFEVQHDQAEDLADDYVSEPYVSEVKSASTQVSSADHEVEDEIVSPADIAASYENTAYFQESSEAHQIAEAAPASASYDGLPDSVNQQIDLIAVLYLPHPATGQALRNLLLALTDIDKPYFAFGLDDADTWHLLTREQEPNMFKRAIYSLQLADRSGPVSRDTLHRFQYAVDQLGLQLGAQVEWKGEVDILGYAQHLDQFCIEVDKMVGFHLIQGNNGPFTGTKFRGLAEANGLTLGDNGAFHFLDDQKQIMFSLVNHDNNPFNLDMLRSIVLKGVSFQLDIPRVKNCAETFNQMVLVAKQMELSLGAHLVDDHQKPLGEVQIDKIRQQLKVIHAQMLARGVTPGSELALRLFS